MQPAAGDLRCLGSLAVLAFGLLPSPSSQAAPNNSLLDISTDGVYVACANRDSGSVTIIDRIRRRKLHEVPVGRHPEGLTFLGASHQLAVAVYDDDRIVWVDARTGQLAGELAVDDEPYGLVSNRDGTRLYATLDYPGRVVEIDVAGKRVLRSFESGGFARGVALSRDERQLFVSLFYSADVVALDLSDGRVVDRWPGISNDNLSRQLVVHPRRDKLYLPHIRSRVTAVHGEGSIFPYVSIIDSAPGEGKRRRRVPMDAFVGNLVTANPWDAAVSADGRSFYLVFAGTNDLFACSVVDDDYREIAFRGRTTVGSNPRAVRVSADGATLYVYEALDFRLSVYDAATLERIDGIAVTENPLTPEVTRGKILFYSALQPMVGRRWISCASCHPDGQPDGRTWHNPEGLRNTQSLAGLARTLPLHWSADRDEVQDFEHTIRGPLMQGRGLIAGPVHPDLGAPNGGRSADLDALAAYTNSHGFTLSPHGQHGLSAAARRGREIFRSAETRCAECHRGPLYTDSRLGGERIRHDVGTGDDSREKMGPAYDTPTLCGVYRTAPYLHDGRAATLADVLTRHNAGDKHGRTGHLSPTQIDDLVEFLMALPYDEAVVDGRTSPAAPDAR